MELKGIDYVSEEELNEYKKELYNNIINDISFYNEVISQGFNNEDILSNLTKFEDYRTNFNIIKNIKTYEDCEKYHCKERIVLVREGKFIERKVELLEPISNNLLYFKRFIIKDFPKQFDNVSLKQCDNKENIKLIGKEIKNKKWVYIHGGHRSGKTFSCIGIINNFINAKDGEVAFINTNTFFGELIDMYFGKNKELFNTYINRIINAELVVLDNFGGEIKNEYIRDLILVPILQGRNNNRKITIFNSNYTLEEVGELYTLNKLSGKIISKNIVDIIQSNITKPIEYVKVDGLY